MGARGRDIPSDATEEGERQLSENRDVKVKAGRLAAAAVVVVATVFAFTAMGGVGMAGGVASLSQYGYGQYGHGKKVTICHKGKRTIRVSVNAWPAHQRHGDVEGACTSVRKHAKKHNQNEAEHAGGNAGATAEGSKHGNGNGKSGDK